MEEIIETTETVATPTDSVNNYESNYYTSNDIYVLLVALALLLVGITTKNLFRKMYINVLGGRKGE